MPLVLACARTMRRPKLAAERGRRFHGNRRFTVRGQFRDKIDTLPEPERMRPCSAS